MLKEEERSSSILDSTTCEGSSHLKCSPHLNLATLGPITLLVSHSEMIILLWKHWVLLEIILWNKSSSQNGFKWCCWAVWIFLVLQIQDHPCLDTGYVLVSTVPLQHSEFVSEEGRFASLLDFVRFHSMCEILPIFLLRSLLCLGIIKDTLI